MDSNNNQVYVSAQSTFYEQSAYIEYKMEYFKNLFKDIEPYDISGLLNEYEYVNNTVILPDIRKKLGTIEDIYYDILEMQEISELDTFKVRINRLFRLRKMLKTIYMLIGDIYGELNENYNINDDDDEEEEEYDDNSKYLVEIFDNIQGNIEYYDCDDFSLNMTDFIKMIFKPKVDDYVSINRNSTLYDQLTAYMRGIHNAININSRISEMLVADF